jgi:hypothetical protein
MKLTEVDLKLSRDLKEGHFWDRKSFHKRERVPVAECGSLCYPRKIEFLVTSKEMKEIPFCQECLNLIEK